MAATNSIETKELALIGKVEMRIALADSDSKLEKILETYLAPLLLKLGSGSVAVRNKVISICQHINSRTKKLSIQLPVLALVQQFKDNPTVALIRHFDLLYIQHGLSRLSPSARAGLMPKLVIDISSDVSISALHGATLFNLILRILPHYKLPPKASKEDDNLRSNFGISDRDTQYLSTWFGKLLLLRLSANPAQGRSSIPGLTTEEVSFLTLQGNADVWDPSQEHGLNLTETKVLVVKLLTSGLFKDEERLLPAVFASADPNSRLSDVGEDLRKQVIAHLSLDKPGIVRELYNVYFGRSGSPSQTNSSAASSVRIPVQMKILDLLIRSPSSAKHRDEVIHVVHQGLAEEDVHMVNGPVSSTSRELSKLRARIVAFIHSVTRQASPDDLVFISRAVVQDLRAFVDRREEEPQSMDEKPLRGRCFEVIGLLAAATQKTSFQQDLSVVEWLFACISEENAGSVIVSIDEALSTILGSFKEPLTGKSASNLEKILLENSQNSSRYARNIRYAVVRYANRCLAQDNVVARWLDIQAIATGSVLESHETLEEARKGLDPYWLQLQNPFNFETVESSGKKFPKLSQLVEYMFNQHSGDLSAAAQAMAVKYCRQILIWESLEASGLPIDIDVNWERKLDSAVTSDPEIRKAIRQSFKSFMEDSTRSNAIQKLWDAAFTGMISDTVSERRVDSGQVFVEICSLSPENLIIKMLPKFRSLEGAVFSNDAALRNLAARAYGLLASHPECPVAELQASSSAIAAKSSEWKTAIGADSNKVDGALLAMAYFISRRHYRQGDDSSIQELLSRYIPRLLDILEQSSDVRMKEPIYECLSQLCLFNILTPRSFSEPHSFFKIVEQVAKQAKAGNEKAIACLGSLSMILDEDEDIEALKQVKDQIKSLHEIRHAETHFAVGEALACLSFGWDSTALSLSFDMEGPLPLSKRRNKTCPDVIDMVLEGCATTKPSLKKASVIWLLCFLQFCGEHREVQERLPRFQAAFKRCLSDRDELVQESASRGLGLVYEKGPRSLKDNLVRDLVSSFSSNRADISGTITEETQLFEPGALPTGDGSITTYKDIMSLASEVGDSSLVYRFMSLASNNAIWSSRAAFGRFGLSNVLSDSSVDGYLAQNPKLYPKLYRYRFDPNSNVRRSMNDIWNALVKDSATTIDRHFSEIMEDLLDNIIGREWRVRQACCAAVADLVQGREFDRFKSYLDRIWSLCFKVLDDIKDSVRSAAAGLARVLTGILLRSLEASSGGSSAARDMLKSVLPFLLSPAGIESSAKEVQALSLHTLLETIKKSNGQTLRPFIPELVERLLGLLSSLEPEAVNYIHLNAAKYNLTEQKIDDMRLSGVRASPLMEAIERCLDLLDESSMSELAPKIQSAMRSAVGMPSKVGCSRVLVSLSTRRNLLFKAHSDRFLKLLEKYVTDRNETVCSSYAASMGYVARGASDQSILALATFARRLYLDAEEDRPRIISADIVNAVSKYATDRFRALATDFLPFVFFARHDGNAQVKQVFEQTWEDTVGGPRAASLYLEEILLLVDSQLGSARWILKHAAALSVAELVKSISTSKGEISESDGERIWPSLHKAMAERTWDGKEHVLEAYVTFVEKGQGFFGPRKDTKAEISKIAVREANRRNAAYQQHALPSLGKVARAMDDSQLMATAYATAKRVLDELSAETTERGKGNDDRDGAGEGDEAKADRIRALAHVERFVTRSMHISDDSYGTADGRSRELTVAGAIGCMLGSIECGGVAVSAGLDVLLDALDSVARANQSASTAVYSATSGAMLNLLKNLETEYAHVAPRVGAALPQRPLHARLQAVLFAPAGIRPEALRLHRSEALLALANFVALLHRTCPLNAYDTLLDDFASYLSNENSTPVRKNLELARQTVLALQPA